MLEQKDFQTILDKTLSEGFELAHTAFHQYDGKTRRVRVSSYNSLVTEIQSERRKLKEVANQTDLEPFCEFLKGIVDKYDLDNDRFVRDIKNIIRAKRREFQKALAKAEQRIKASDSTKAPDSQPLEEPLQELDEESYKTIITYEVERWFESFFPQLFQNIKSFFLSKEKFDEHKEGLIKMMEDLVEGEIPLLIGAYFPLNVRLSQSGEEEDPAIECTENIITQIEKKIEDIAALLGLSDIEIIVLKANISSFYDRIKFRRIIELREQKQIPTGKYEEIEEAVSFFQYHLEAKIAEALLGKERYAYAMQQVKKGPFQASSDHLLYPVEMEMLRAEVLGVIAEKNLNTRNALLAELRSSSIQDAALDIAVALNRKVHGGTEIRDGSELLALAQAYIDKYYPEAPSQDSKTTTASGDLELEEKPSAHDTNDGETRRNISPPPTVEEQKDELPPPLEERKNVPPPPAAEPIPESSPSGLLTDPLAKVLSEESKPTPLTAGALPKPEQPRRGLTTPTLGELSPDDLSPEERPDHIPESIFQRINAILKWAREADRKAKATRSIHKVIVAKTFIITTHLRAQSLEQVLVHLIELERLKELLGEEITMSHKKIPFEDWVDAFLHALDHLRSGEPEKDLGNGLAQALQKLPIKIFELERELALMETAQSRAEQLKVLLTPLCSELEGLEIEATQLVNDATRLAAELNKAIAAQQDYGPLLQQLTQVRLNTAICATRKTELSEKKMQTEAELQPLDELLSQVEEKKNKCEALKTARQNTFTIVRNAIAEIEELTQTP